MHFLPISRKSTSRSFQVPGALFLLLAAAPFSAWAQSGGTLRETTVEDSPGRLILEVTVPTPTVVDGPDGAQVTAAGFSQPSAAGAPALPWYGFPVATGARAPGISLEPLEWNEVTVPKEVAGIPRFLTTRQSEPYKDPVLFAAAAAIVPRVSDFQIYRGLRLRNISLPIAAYSQGSGRVRVLKKFRVTVTFPNPTAAPAAGVRPWLLQAAVKNPQGGQYLVSLPRRAPLRRTAAATLSSGAYLKLKVGDKQVDGFDEDGVYSLSYEVAHAAGLPSNYDVSKLRIYAGPQDVLGVPMAGLIPSTLHEIPIEVVDAQSDNSFNEGDRILFYAHGTSLWKPVGGPGGSVRWQFTHDPYSFENYYYLDWGGENTAQRLPISPYIAAPTTMTSAPHYLRGEKDLATGSCDPSGYFDPETGDEWYWYRKGSCQYGAAPGFAGTPAILSKAQLSSAPADTLKQRVVDSVVWFGAFSFPVGNADGFIPRAGTTALPYSDLGVPGSWYSRTPGASAGDLLGIDSLEWVDGNDRFEGYTVRYRRSLAWNGKPRRIFPAMTGARVGYRIDSAAAGLRVVRVEAGVATRTLALQAAGSAVLFSDSAGDGEDVQYFVYQNPVSMAASAVTAEAVSGQSGVIRNLSTGDGLNPEYLIIAPQALLPEAVDLRDYRDNSARAVRYSTAVVRTEDIYREWSSGRLSPVAIRDFLRWAMNRWGSGGTSGNLKYVALYGDGHYDYRNIRNGTSNNPLPNNIPPFNWDFGDNFNPMSTDDFYATLDSGETWDGAPSLDISMGRLPFQTREQARAYQNKVSRYENPSTAGEWRSRILLAGDDDMQRDVPDRGFTHTAQAEGLGNVVLAQDSGMRKDQVYLFDYPRNGAYLKPEATQDLINFYNRGVLFSTFFGHGAYNQMADEVLLKTNDGLARFRNTDRYFMMTIFSCTVGRFDKLADEGMSEQFLRVADIGAIGAVSATRESYPLENEALGDRFSIRVFDASADSVARGMGDALRLAKNEIGSQSHLNNQKYVLQGEPVTVINRPGLGVHLDSVPGTLQSLGCDTLKGRVAFGSGKGSVNLRIISGDVSKTYLSVQVPQTVEKPGQVLFERTVGYADSAFSVGYFLPKQVPFGDTAAKLQIFAWDSTQLRESAVLVANRHIIPGGNCIIDTDKRGPRIAVTGCNTAESGGADFPGKVKISLPYCLQITVNDTVGGVLSGDGPDEGTTVEVVGSVAPFHPQAGVDDLYTKTYQVTLSNQDLAEGTHLLKISARDGFGNLGARQISLEVSQDTALRFIKAFNVPNPMKRSGTTFYFSTTLPVEEGGALESPNVDRVNFHLRIFNQLGYMVQEFRDASSGQTHWDGKDAWGRQLANGVYFYQVTATWNEANGSPQGGRSVSRKNVLVISR